MIKLSNEITQYVTTSVTNKATLERTDKDLFLSAYKEYKSVSKQQRGHVTGLLNNLVSTLTKSTNVQNAMKRTFKLAFMYLDMQVITRFDNLEYSNISGLVKLFKYVDKHLSEKSDELRSTIKEVYVDGMSPHRYNNEMAGKIVVLKEEYKLKEVEGEFVFIDVVNYMKSSITHMTKAQLVEVMALLEDRVDEVEEEELAATEVA